LLLDRPEGALSDLALVLRGGLELLASDLEKSAQKCMEMHGEYGLTIWAAEVDSYDELVARIPRAALLHRWLRPSSMGALRARGLSIRATAGAPHYTVTLPDIAASTVESFRQAFLDPILNPLPRR
jgi:hypothetical protein